MSGVSPEIHNGEIEKGYKYRGGEGESGEIKKLEYCKKWVDILGGVYYYNNR